MRKSCLGVPRALAVLSVVVALGLQACGAEDAVPSVPGATGSSGLPPTGGSPCAAGELPLDGGGCQRAGLPLDSACAPAELALEGGSCQRAGIPAEACAVGFVADGRDGCDVVLPNEVCPPGQMAVPGESACHELSPCGLGTYGDIPIDVTTELVDASYLGNDSDGSLERPWKTVQKGVDAAAAGAIVAVAAGRYAEGVVLSRQPVRVWGRCPAMVELVGPEGTNATLQIVGAQVAGSEVHGLALTGFGTGLQVDDTSSVTIEQVWIHEGGSEGLAVTGATGVTLRSSLIEQNHRIGAVVLGSDATIEASVVRSTVVGASRELGWGVAALVDRETGGRAQLTLKGSVVEQNRQAGIAIAGSDATIESSVVRDNLNSAGGGRAMGIMVLTEPGTGESGGLILRGSLIAQNQDTGVWVAGSKAIIERSVVRDTRVDVAENSGEGVVVMPTRSLGVPGALTVRSSVIERNHNSGVLVSGSDATVEASIVRDSQAVTVENGGSGIAVQADRDVKMRGVLTLRASLIEQNSSVGVNVQGSDATVEGSIVRDTLANSEGTDGWGISVRSDSVLGERGALAVRSSLIAHTHGTGIVILGARVTIEASVVRGSVCDVLEQNGGGIVVTDGPDTQERGELTLRSSLIAQNENFGVIAFGSDTTIEGSVVRDTRPNLSGDNGFGVSVQDGPVNSQAGTLIMRNSLVSGSSELGVLIYQADGTIETSAVKDTHPRLSDGLFGDGLVVVRGTGQIRAMDVLTNGRSGALFVDSAGSVSGVNGSGNRFGLVLQGDTRPVLGENNLFKGNTEQDQISGGDLPVPDGKIVLP